MKDDALWVDRARQGDQDAFAHLVSLHQNMVYTLALRKTGSHHDAEEITQTVFLKVWQGLPSFQGQAAFSTWLYRLTANACIDFLRKNQRHRNTLSLDDPNLPLVAADSADSPEAQAETKAQQEAFTHAITQLPDSFREILLLREADGLRYQEIAQLLGLEPGTVKSRLARARIALRDLLAEQGNLWEFSSSKKTESKQSRRKRGTK